jgi:hypothetical protein
MGSVVSLKVPKSGPRPISYGSVKIKLTVRDLELQQIDTSPRVFGGIVAPRLILDFSAQPFLRQPLQSGFIRRPTRMFEQECGVDTEGMADTESVQVAFERLAEQDRMGCDDGRGRAKKGSLDSGDGMGGVSQAFLRHAGPFGTIIDDRVGRENKVVEYGKTGVIVYDRHPGELVAFCSFDLADQLNPVVTAVNIPFRNLWPR